MRVTRVRLERPSASVTSQLVVVVPASTGTPDKVPSAAAWSPEGTPSSGSHVYGVDPPEACSDARYRSPTTADGST